MPLLRRHGSGASPGRSDPLSDFLADFFGGLGDVVYSAWPEVDGNIRTVQHANRVPWAELEPPCAVIASENLMRQDYPVNSNLWSGPVDIYYVCETDGPMSPIQTKLLALLAQVQAHGLPSGQCLREQEMNWSDEIPANGTLAEKGASHRTGYLRLLCEAGELAGGDVWAS